MKTRTVCKMVSGILALCIAAGGAYPMPLFAETEDNAWYAESTAGEDAAGSAFGEEEGMAVLSDSAKPYSGDMPEAESSAVSEGETAEDPPGADDGMTDEEASSDALTDEEDKIPAESTASGPADETDPAEEEKEDPDPAEVSEDASHAPLEAEDVPKEVETEDMQSDAGNTDAGEETEEFVPEDEKPSPYGEISIVPEAEGKDFSTRRLILAIHPDEIVDTENILSSFNGVCLMQYASEEEAKIAYSYYLGRAAFVDVDIQVSAADDPVPAAPDGMNGTENPLSILEEEMQSVQPSPGRTIALVDTGASYGVREAVSVIGEYAGDDNGHGDRMVAAILEQNPEASILSIKALDANGKGSISSIYAAIQYAVAAGCDIINLSVSAYTTAENAALADAVNEAVSRGILVVGAAGNNGSDARYFTPGGIEAALIAGACDEGGVRLPSSNYGSTVDVNVVADTTSQGAAKLSGFLSAHGQLEGINENGLLYSTDYEGTAEVADEDGLLFYLIDENGEFIASDSKSVARFTMMYGDTPMHIHYESSSGRLLYCIQRSASSSAGTYGEVTANPPYPMSNALKAALCYVIGNGLQTMGGRCVNPAYRAERADTVANNGRTLYRRDYEITTNAVWKVIKELRGDSVNGGDVGLANPDESAKANRLASDAIAYANANGGAATYTSNELRLVKTDRTTSISGATLAMHKTSDGLAYETDPFVVINTAGRQITSVAVAGSTGAYIETVGTETAASGAPSDTSSDYLDKKTVKTYKLKISKENAQKLSPNPYTFTLTVTGQVRTFGAYLYRQGGDQTVVFAPEGSLGSATLQAKAVVDAPPENGKAYVIKKSSAPSMTDGNDSYSLAGAVYGIYTSAADAAADAAAGSVSAKAAGRLTTKADGTSDPLTIKAGSYIIREVKASPGYRLDPSNHQVTVEVNKTASVTSSEEPLNDPSGITLTKKNGATGGDDTVPEGAALEGAEYTVSFFPAKNADPAKDTPARTWVIRTKKYASGTYGAFLSRDCVISGSAAYVVNADTGAYVLPLGTVSVRETKAPKGFLIDPVLHVGRIREDASSRSGVSITWDNGSSGTLKYTKEASWDVKHTEYPIPEIKTSAKDGKTGDHVGTVGKSETVVDTVTYKNLVIGRSYTLKGTLMDKKTGKAVLVGGREVTAEKTFVPDKTDGTVTLTIPVDSRALGNTTGVVFERLYDSSGEAAVHADINDAAQSITYPKVSTDAVDTESGSHTGTIGKEVTVTDHVTVEGLLAGHTYTVKGTLMDKGTGEAVTKDGKEVTAEKTFTADKNTAEFDLTFTVDSTLLQGHIAVVFERLYHNEKEVAVHTDIHDEDQTVYYPLIETEASDEKTGDDVGTVEKNAVFIDRVIYSGLIKGETYTVKGVLYDKGTGDVITQDGAALEAEKTFTAEDNSGSVSLAFALDSTVLTGHTAVAFEKLFLGDREIAHHEDLEDEKQSVTYPEVTTDAADGTTGDHVGTSEAETSVVDIVHTKGLVPGREYTIRGILMEKESGTPFTDDGKEVTASVSFTAEQEEEDHELVFTFSSLALSGKTLVAFEYLEHAGIDVAVHTDIEDEDQSVHYPEILTQAKDGTNGTQIGTIGETETVIDLVTCRNLIPGETYTIKGVLVNKADGEPIMQNGGQVAAEYGPFTAENSEMQIEMAYEVDSVLLQDTSVVVFEDLLYKEIVTASHADTEDLAQRILYPERPHKSVDRMSNSFHEEHTWIVTQKIPEGYASLDKDLQSFEIEDVLDPRLSFAEFKGLSIEEGDTLAEGEDYELTLPDAEWGGSIYIRFTEDAGIEKLKANEGKVITLVFSTVINETAGVSDMVVYEDRTYEENENENLIPNQAKVSIGGISNLTEIPFVYTAGIEIRKTATDGAPLAGAEFALFCEDGSAFLRGDTPYTVTTGNEGAAHFDGLKNGSYIVRETKAPQGMELLKDDINIRIENGVVSSVNGHAVRPDRRTITVTDQGKIILMTGGPGGGIYYFFGILAICGAVLAFFLQRRRRAL